MSKRAAFVLVLSVVVAACGTVNGDDTGSPELGSTPPAGQDGSASTVPSSSTSTEAPAATSTTSNQGGPVLTGEDIVKSALEDLASRLNVDQEDIDVRSASEGYWSDMSLGCPVEGEMYAQLIMDGYRVELDAGGNTYVYHQGGTEPVFLCENPNDDAFVPGKTVPEPSIPPPID